MIKVKNFHCMTLQIDIVITTLSFQPATGYKTPSALCSAFFTISELFIYVPPFLSILLSYFCGINQLVMTNSCIFMIAQQGGNVNRIGAMRGAPVNLVMLYKIYILNISFANADQPPNVIIKQIAARIMYNAIGISKYALPFCNVFRTI